MAIDESFKKAGSIPFKWEIKPGVPKQQHNSKQAIAIQSSPPPIKLRPPPSAEPRSMSFRSAPRGRSDRVDVVSVGCFQASPRMRRKPSVKKSDDDRYASDVETPSFRWSVSLRKSVVSPFRESPATSSFGSSSDRSSSSPRPDSDPEWAGFGLF